MCGIFGKYNFVNEFIDENQIKRMGNVLAHRGPDNQGIYFGETEAIGNQRLSIIDIKGGNQPFSSSDGNIQIVQNGEIYNYLELRKSLKKIGCKFKTNSDTEVILKLYETQGENFVNKLNGMFAIAIFDKNLDKLFLYRDRVGVKPLYYFKDNKSLLFASEIKSILEGKIKKEINFEAINQYLTFNYVPPPLTCFKEIYHVNPGTYLKISRNEKVEEKIWWDLSDFNQIDQDESSFIEKFNHTLSESVSIRLRADVDFGAFLSGGVDSSSIVGHMSKKMDNPVETFCIGFEDKNFDESDFAQKASNLFSSSHNIQFVGPEIIKDWDEVIYKCDQPHGDISFIPTYRLSKLAKKKVKMVLTGDGGDEIFAGYDKYKDFFKIESNYSNEEAFKKNYYENISLFSSVEQKRLIANHSDDYQSSKILFNSHLDKVRHWDFINQSLYIDMMMLLPGNNLVKPDRMGMAVSLEARTPYLDYRMIELAFSLRGSLKIKKGETKYLMKKALVPLIGKELSYRKKQMFTVPIGNWFRSHLHNDVLKYLNKMKEDYFFQDFFNLEEIDKLFNDHLESKKNNTRQVRSLIALKKWVDIFNMS
ncbi:MAG: asparagine synthase (glutamine-hydrolyzing) [Gammaproteobacteria bacterium]